MPPSPLSVSCPLSVSTPPYPQHPLTPRLLCPVLLSLYQVQFTPHPPPPPHHLSSLYGYTPYYSDQYPPALSSSSRSPSPFRPAALAETPYGPDLRHITRFCGGGGGGSGGSGGGGGGSSRRPRQPTAARRARPWSPPAAAPCGDRPPADSNRLGSTRKIGLGWAWLRPDRALAVSFSGRHAPPGPAWHLIRAGPFRVPPNAVCCCHGSGPESPGHVHASRGNASCCLWSGPGGCGRRVLA